MREKVRFFIAPMNTAGLDALRELIEAGTLSPVIDHVYSLGAARQAMARVVTGHAHGKVVATV